jgi:hypothetical protein
VADSEPEESSEFADRIFVCNWVDVSEPVPDAEAPRGDTCNPIAKSEAVAEPEPVAVRMLLWRVDADDEPEPDALAVRIEIRTLVEELEPSALELADLI